MLQRFSRAWRRVADGLRDPPAPPSETYYLFGSADPSAPSAEPVGRDVETSAGGRASAARELLLIFTAGWLGGGGVLTAMNGAVDGPIRLLAAAQALAAILWFVPRARLGGLAASLAVLAAMLIRHLAQGGPSGAVIFYMAVVLYLCVGERRR